MDLKSIVTEIADQADDLLVDITTRKEARVALSEYLKSDFPDLDADDRLIVVARVLKILDDEEFVDVGVNEGETVWGESAAEADEPVN